MDASKTITANFTPGAETIAPSTVLSDLTLTAAGSPYSVTNDLIIEAAESIADQRDQMMAAEITAENIEQQLDFSAFEQRFTGGDPDVKRFYTSWFEKPFRKAALKALTGEPMVKIGPRAEQKADE